jgi:hypothetical protein
MEMQDKAFFNLLRFTQHENGKTAAEPWQVENYRALPISDLFGRLQSLGVALSEQTFLEYGNHCDTPEELAECLWLDESDPIGEDKSYLLLFELWRRLLPEKETLSIFADKLDDLIDRYTHDDPSAEEPLQAALTELENVLDAHADDGADPTEVYTIISEYFAHDLASFIHDLIDDLIDVDPLYASELLDGFYSYMPDKSPFDALKHRLLSN